MGVSIRRRTKGLLAQLADRGYHARSIPVRLLPSLQAGIERAHRCGLVDEAFFQERLTGFHWSVPDCLPDARSILVLAVPQPQIRITFTRRSGPFSVIVPPTYLQAERIDRKMETVLEEVLAEQGYRIGREMLPVKLLAVRSGLAKYGKNNITYIEGLGSLYRLAAYYTDWPCPDDTWREIQMMEACRTCSACLKICPTGAIDPKRFLLHAERCLSYLNEKPGDVPFPDWVDPTWHNSLIGCMRCQIICPQNRAVQDWTEDGPTFSEDETSQLVQGVTSDHLSRETRGKLASWDLLDMLDVLPRNLTALFNRQVES